MIQKIFSVFLLLCLITANAQENTSSQYSLHGIGIKRFRGTAANIGSGGLSLFSDELSPNILNPATYADLKRTSFSVGGSYNILKLEGNDGSNTITNTTFDYLTISIPTKYFGFGFGIVPHSSVGNDITTTDETSGDVNENIGKGDVNRIYLGLGATVYKGLKVGAEVRYNFGRLDNTILTIPDSGAGQPRQTIEQTDVSGLSYIFSSLYDFKFKDKYTLRASYQYEGSNTHDFSNSQEIANVQINPNSNPSIDPENRDFIDTDDRSFKLPSVSTFGLALINKNKWAISAEAFFSNNENFKDRFKSRDQGNTTVSFIDGSGMKLGGYIIPNANSLTSYFSRINYRAGFRYENLGLQINNTEINEFGISFGLGLPLPRGYSNLDLSFEYGARGENTSEAIKEQFVNFSVGLNLSDKWFRKRKYD